MLNNIITTQSTEEDPVDGIKELVEWVLKKNFNGELDHIMLI